MSNRKRINMSVDPETYSDLQRIKKKYGFHNLCEMMVAYAHIMVDHLQCKSKRRFDLPDDEDEYIGNMFDELGNSQRTPTGEVPVRHNNRNIYKYNDGKR